MTTFEPFIDEITAARQTELSRLGSSRGLYADTAGEIETDPVLRAAATAEHAAWETFSTWADDESDPELATTFASVAEDERDHYGTVLEFLDEEYDPDAVPALHRYLRGIADTPERLGGFVGRVLASRRSKDQVVGFFVGNADPTTAERFRSFGADLDDQLAAVEDHYDRICDDEASRTRAEESALGAIDAAYEEYVDSLESLGVNPKPVC